MFRHLDRCTYLCKQMNICPHMCRCKNTTCW